MKKNFLIAILLLSFSAHCLSVQSNNNWSSGEGKISTVPRGTFMVLFPTEAHRPNITPGGNKAVKKIVLKIKEVPEN